jgi:hypothetical protein
MLSKYMSNGRTQATRQFPASSHEQVDIVVIYMTVPHRENRQTRAQYSTGEEHCAAVAIPHHPAPAKSFGIRVGWGRLHHHDAVPLQLALQCTNCEVMGAQRFYFSGFSIKTLGTPL